MTKEKRLAIRVTEEEYVALMAAMVRSGRRTLTAYLRDTVLDEARREERMESIRWDSIQLASSVEKSVKRLQGQDKLVQSMKVMHEQLAALRKDVAHLQDQIDKPASKRPR